MSTQPPELPPQPSQPGQPEIPPPEINPPGPDVDVPAGEEVVGRRILMPGGPPHDIHDEDEVRADNEPVEDLHLVKSIRDGTGQIQKSLKLW